MSIVAFCFLLLKTWLLLNTYESFSLIISVRKSVSNQPDFPASGREGLGWGWGVSHERLIITRVSRLIIMYRAITQPTRPSQARKSSQCLQGTIQHIRFSLIHHVPATISVWCLGQFSMCHMSTSRESSQCLQVTMQHTHFSLIHYVPATI